jgi:hypothetical protein
MGETCLDQGGYGSTSYGCEGCCGRRKEEAKEARASGLARAVVRVLSTELALISVRRLMKVVVQFFPTELSPRSESRWSAIST